MLDFKEDFCAYVLSYPMIHSMGGQQTLIYSAGLDANLQHQIQFNTNAITFVSLLYQMLDKWGSLSDGRNPFAEIIKSVMQSVGPDKRRQGQMLLDALGAGLFESEPQEERGDPNFEPVESTLLRTIYKIVTENHAMLKELLEK
jgi:hypothetical protein